MKSLKIYPDTCPENPREFSEYTSKIAYKHRNYTLGDEVIGEPIEWLEDKLGLQRKGEYTNERLAQLETQFFKKFIALPVYIYDHSGVSMSTTPFSCQWDSSKVGYIYVAKGDVKKDWNVNRISPKLKQQILEQFKAEIKEFSSYISGDVYAFDVISENESDIDSCGGFFGDNFEENGLIDYLNYEDFGLNSREELVKYVNSIEISYGNED